MNYTGSANTKRFAPRNAQNAEESSSTMALPNRTSKQLGHYFTPVHYETTNHLFNRR